MKLGDRVTVKQTAKESQYRGMVGTIILIGGPSELVSVEFVEEVIPHDFYQEELELITEDDLS